MLLRSNPRQDQPNGRKPLVPISIYVLWHPGYRDGPRIAQDLYDWFFDTTDLQRAGLGIPVHFRSADWREEDSLATHGSDGAPGARERRPIELCDAIHNVLIPLVDDHMVADESWRDDLIEMAEQQHSHRRAATGQTSDDEDPRDLGDTPEESRRTFKIPKTQIHLLPVQLTPAISRLPGPVTRFQAIRVDHWNDENPDPADEKGRASQLETRLLRLRRLITQALVRQIDPHHHMIRSIFISHAKIDREFGPGIAEKLRDVAAGYGQIEKVFYDENSLLPGRGWKEPLEEQTALGRGFIAVLSDQYSYRYWCRMEVTRARRPTPIPRRCRGRGRDVTIWHVQPTVVISALNQSWSRIPPELGGVLIRAWNEDCPEEIFDQLFLEALRAEFQRIYAAQLARICNQERHYHLLTWAPEDSTLLSMRAQAFALGRWSVNDSTDVTIAYPGQGLQPDEEQRLKDNFEAGTEILSFVKLIDRSSGDAPPAATRGTPDPEDPFDGWPQVWISNGDAEDLDRLGYSSPTNRWSPHVTTVVLRLARALLDGGVRIAFGSVLREEQRFADMIVEATSGLVPHDQSTTDGDNQLGHQAKKPKPTPTAPLECLLPWPYSLGVGVDERAMNIGICAFHDVIPDNAPEVLSSLTTDAFVDKWWMEDGTAVDVDPARAAAQWTANAVTCMRRQLATKTQAAVLLGGRTTGWSGWMPGIAEEFLSCCLSSCVTGWKDRTRRASMHPLSVWLYEAATKREHERRVSALKRMRPDQVRVLLLGEYGGVIRRICRYVLKVGEMPREVTYEFHEQRQPLDRILPTPPWAARWVKQRFELLEAALEGLRNVANMKGKTEIAPLGLTVEQWRTFASAASSNNLASLLRSKVAPKLSVVGAPRRTHKRKPREDRGETEP